MKELLLFRHGKSSWDDPDLEDYDRNLNSRGKRDVPVMASRLLERHFTPEKIFCSPSRRTRKTLKLLKEQCNWPGVNISYPDELYLASVQTILETLSACDSEVSRLMVVGHNPGLTEFINIYSNLRLDNLPTSGMCCIKFDLVGWHEIGQQKGEMLWVDYPKGS